MQYLDGLAAWWFRPPPDTRVTKVYAFNEGAREGFHELVPWGDDMLGRGWEDVVEALTGWDEYRLEVRYVCRGQKNRIVLRPGDALSEEAFVWCPREVVYAQLLARQSARSMDVTARVAKYAGSDGAFRGVHVHDMFPFDDHDDNALRFHSLWVLTLGKMKTVPYAVGSRV